MAQNMWSRIFESVISKIIITIILAGITVTWLFLREEYGVVIPALVIIIIVLLLYIGNIFIKSRSKGSIFTSVPKHFLFPDSYDKYADLEVNGIIWSIYTFMGRYTDDLFCSQPKCSSCKLQLIKKRKKIFRSEYLFCDDCNLEYALKNNSMRDEGDYVERKAKQRIQQ